MQCVCGLRAEVLQDPICKLKLSHSGVEGRGLEEGQGCIRGCRGSKRPRQLWTAGPRSLALGGEIRMVGSRIDICKLSACEKFLNTAEEETNSGQNGDKSEGKSQDWGMI